MITSSQLKRTKSHVCVAQRTAEEPSTKSVLDLPRDMTCQSTFLAHSLLFSAHNNVGSVWWENIRLFEKPLYRHRCVEMFNQMFGPRGSQHCRNTSSSTCKLFLFCFISFSWPGPQFCSSCCSCVWWCCFAKVYALKLFSNCTHTYFVMHNVWQWQTPLKRLFFFPRATFKDLLKNMNLRHHPCRERE